MSKRWQKVEIAFLKKHAGKKSSDELAQRFHTDVATVEEKLKELRLAAANGADAEARKEAVDHYRQGLEALYQEKWERAEKLLAQVTEEGHAPDLVARARQFRSLAHEKRANAKVEADDPYLLAVFEKNRGNLADALTLCTRDKRSEKDGRFAYLAAAVCSLEGDLAAGARHLGRAIELDVRNRSHALHDPDLAPLREDPAHAQLLAP